MSLRWSLIAARVATVGAATSIVVAPIAVADTIMPVVGQSASEGIDELQAEGYDVQINWLNGSPRVPLEDCSISGVHNPDRSPGSAQTPTTVYVDVTCPNHEGEGGVGVGGIG